ncbi:MAG: DUF5995 family protein [Salinisphaeraceae bacterium]|nr:DUF5995 family protein [Salinisphaeraceae bacterium]
MKALQILMVGYLCCTFSAWAEDAPFIPTTNLLPPLVQEAPAVDRAPDCGDDGLECILWVEEQLAGWESFFGCDHRAVFPTVYRTLTHEARLYLEDNPEFFDDPAGLGYEAVLFYALYEEMITAHLNGEAIPPAWQVAMDAAKEGDATGLQDMVMAINAHVQRDMPFAVAETGLNLPDGTSRKADHDRFNQVLNDAYDSVIQAVGERYDPLLLQYDAAGLIIDDIAANKLVEIWREGVWRNAERVSSTRDTPLWDSTVLTIEVVAQLTGLAMSPGVIPGYRQTRDAYCVEQQAIREASESEDSGEDTPEAGLTLRASSSGGCSIGMGNNGMGWLLALLMFVWLWRKNTQARGR